MNHIIFFKINHFRDRAPISCPQRLEIDIDRGRHYWIDSNYAKMR